MYRRYTWPAGPAPQELAGHYDLDYFDSTPAYRAAPATQAYGRRRQRFGRFGSQQLPALRRALATATVGHPSVIADPHQPFRQHVQQKPPDEFGGVQCHLALLAAVRVIFPAEGDLAVLQTDQPVIGDGHAMGVARQIVQHMLRSAERLADIDHPAMAVQHVQKSRERARFRQPA